MSNTEMRASLTVTADASALVTEMRKGSEGFREIRREATATAAAAAKAAGEQGRMAERLNRAFNGFGAGQRSARESAAAFEAAIDAEAAAMRDLTLALDPAARAQIEFARVQEQVNRAVRLNIVSQEEATRVMGLLSSRQKALGGGFASVGSGVQNASYQIADFAVQVQAGQAASLALAQQLPQLIGGFGVWGAVAGAAVAIGAPLVTMWLKSGDAAGTLDDRLDKLEASLDSVRERLKLLNDTRLDETFGNLAGDVREMTAALLSLERAAELKNLRSALDKLTSESIEPGFWQVLGSNAVGKTRLDTGNFTPADLRRENYDKLTGGTGPDFDEFQRRRSELNELAKAGDVDGTVKAISELVQSFANGGPISEINDDLLEILVKMGDFATKTAEVEAAFSGTAGSAAMARQIDDMVRGAEQQAELSRTILKFGEDSAEVEALRARHTREALDIQLREMDVVRGSAEEKRAIAALDAELTASAELRAQERQKESDALFADLSRQSELSAAILEFGEESAEVEAVRARHAREVNDERLKEMGLAPNLLAMARELFSIEQLRARQIRSDEANRRADEMIAGLRQQVEINRAIALHGRDSLQVKELMIAAQRREYQESLRNLEVSEARKRQLLEEWERANGLGQADPFGQISASRDILRAQAERIQQLKLEQALLGQSETVRSRILALWKAEQEIRRAGIDTGSERARMIRQAAAEEDALTRSIQRQKQAWDDVRSSAESAIDGIFDKLLDGDWKGAFEEVAKDISGMLFDLSVRNPAKNAALGKELPTISDIGGLSGIWSRLTGRGDGSEIALPDPITDVGTMDVQAANVVIGGPGVMSLLASMPNAANSTVSPGALSGLPGSGDVQSQMWSFFAAKGLKPHQIAGIMGNAAAESGFDPGAVGDNGTSFGLFQHHAGRGRGLLDAVGGKSGLGNIQAQMEYVWKELMTTESAAMRKLLASTDVRGATEAWVGFERPAGYSAANPAGSMHFDKRLASAEAALSKFGTATETTAANLGTLGGGFDVLGTALTGFAQGGSTGALNGLLGGLGSALAGMLGIPGFFGGGPTGGSSPDEVRGLVHGQEYVFDAASTARIGVPTLEAIRRGSIKGYKSGGYIGPYPAIRFPEPSLIANNPAPVDTRPIIQITNNSSTPVTGEVEETRDARGQRQYKLVLSDTVASGMSAPGGSAQRTLRNQFGVTPAVRRRGG